MNEYLENLQWLSRYIVPSGLLLGLVLTVNPVLLLLKGAMTWACTCVNQGGHFDDSEKTKFII